MGEPVRVLTTSAVLRTGGSCQRCHVRMGVLSPSTLLRTSSVEGLKRAKATGKYQKCVHGWLAAGYGGKTGFAIWLRTIVDGGARHYA